MKLPAVQRILFALALALDYCAELIFFWRTHEPMTVSSRCGLALRRGETHTFLALLGRALNALDRDHTEKAIANDINRAMTAILELDSKT
jgi:hypothetical protein